MGVLKAVGSEQARLTKPWWLAADSRGCLQTRCQKKLIFKGSFFIIMQGQRHDSVRFRYLSVSVCVCVWRRGLRYACPLVRVQRAG